MAKSIMLAVCFAAALLLLSIGPSESTVHSNAPTDDVDRIVARVGVDAIHSVDEEARMRAMTHQVLDAAPAFAPLREGPDFERVFRHLIMDQQRMRRDPSVFGAYRSTLERMLTPAEVRVASEFYASSKGLKAHIAVIEADKAAAEAMEEVPGRRSDDPAVRQAFRDTLDRMLSAKERAMGNAFYGSDQGQKIHAAVLAAEAAAGVAMEEVATSMGKGPPPGFSHNFDYGIDVFFAKGSSEVDPTQRGRIASIVRKPRQAAPDEAWCVLLVGFSATGERESALAVQRRDAVHAVLTQLGIPASTVRTELLDSKRAYLKIGEPEAEITEIEQFPCRP